MKETKWVWHAFCAGCCAAFAPVLVKVALSDTTLLFLPYYELQLIAMIVCFALMFACNAVMGVCFAKAMDKSETTLAPSVLTTGCNFFLSGIFGWLFFGEVLSTMWWAGASLIILGILIISSGKQNNHQEQKEL